MATTDPMPVATDTMTPGTANRTFMPLDPLNIQSNKRSSRRMTNRRTGSRYPDMTPAAPLINQIMAAATANGTGAGVASLRNGRMSHSNKRYSNKLQDHPDENGYADSGDTPSLLRTNTSKSDHQPQQPYPSLMTAIINSRANSLHSLHSTQSSHRAAQQSAINRWMGNHPRVSYVYEKINEFGAMNLLLVLVPVALVLRYTDQHPAAQFITACLAIMPLAGWMGDATEAISDRMGPSAGGIMNATFGNAAELIVALFAVFRNEDILVKASLVGSIISNVLLVLGCAILAGGIKFKIQTFNKNGASVGSTMLVVATIGVLVPAIYHEIILSTAPVAASLPYATNFAQYVTDYTNYVNSYLAFEEHLSLGISCVLIITYVLTLFFQLHTHSFFYDEIDAEEQALLTASIMHTAANDKETQEAQAKQQHAVLVKHDNAVETAVNDRGEPQPVRQRSLPPGRSNSIHPLPISNNSNSAAGEVLNPEMVPQVAIDVPAMNCMPSNQRAPSILRSPSAQPAQPAQRVSSLRVDEHSVVPAQSEADEEEPEEEEMSVKKAIIILSVATAFVGLLSDVLTSAVQAAGESLGLTETFMGVIIVAIVGNAAEHWSAVTCAMSNKMDISLSIAFGSALQVAMFVLPVVILCSYARETPMLLVLPLMEMFAMAGSVVLAWMVVQSGGTNWLEGLMLLMIYVILAIAFFYVPEQTDSR